MTKIKLIKLFIATILISSLSGCATTKYYTPVNESTILSTIQGKSLRMGAFDWERYRVEKIDGKDVRYNYWSISNQYDYKIPVDSGFHVLLVHVIFNKKFGNGGPFESFILLEGKIEEGKSYQIDGVITENLVNVWLVDKELGQRTEWQAKNTFKSKPDAMYYPVIIPSQY